MTVAAYIRVSSKGQDHAMQRAAIEKAAGERFAVAEWFAEKKSAKTTQRPELERLRAAVRAGTFRRVYAYRLDRLVRSGPADAFELMKELRTNGCELVTLSDGIVLKPDKDDITSNVLIFAFSLAAQLELQARAERIATAREYHEEHGLPWGRPKKTTPEQLAAIVRLHGEGRTVRQIAVAVKLPRSRVQRELEAERSAALVEAADVVSQSQGRPAEATP